MEKVWLRGVPGRGKEVIDLLKKWGGKSPVPTSSFAEDPRYVVFIDHDGRVDYICDKCELAKVVMDCYKPINLPEGEPFWDDGTIVIRRNILQTFGDDFAIVNASEKVVPFFTAYAVLTTENKIYYRGYLPFTEYRLATDVETAVFVKRLKEIGKFWNPWTKKMENL